MTKVMGALLTHRLIAERTLETTTKADPALNRTWRSEPDRRAVLLEITDVGITAIGVDTDRANDTPAADPSLLMWDMRRNLNPEPLPKRRTVVQFMYHDLPSTKRDWWLAIEPEGEFDLCWADPGFEVDL